jgi:hypothetical protein
VNGRSAWALLALLIASNSSLRADPLAQPEKDYVALMTLSVGVTNMCDGYDVDDKNVLKFADTRAVDIHKLGLATFKAIEEIVGMDYDRSALIPEVTGIVRSVSDKESRCVEIGKSGRLRPVREAADRRRFFATEIQLEDQLASSTPYTDARPILSAFAISKVFVRIKISASS